MGGYFADIFPSGMTSALDIFNGRTRQEKNCIFGLARLELATPCPPDMCATQLRHSPLIIWINADYTKLNIFNLFAIVKRTNTTLKLRL